MLNLPPSVHIYLAVGHVDMRKSFDGLSSIVREHIKVDPLSGHLFTFINHRGDRCKILFWDRNGYCLVYKRLEIGVFKIPKENVEGGYVELDAAELALMLEGIDLCGAKRRKQWSPYNKK